MENETIIQYLIHSRIFFSSQLCYFIVYPPHAGNMPYQRWSALTASSYNKMYRQNPPTTKAWNVDTVLKKRSQSQGGTAIHNFLQCA